MDERKLEFFAESYIIAYVRSNRSLHGFKVALKNIADHREALSVFALSPLFPTASFLDSLRIHLTAHRVDCAIVRLLFRSSSRIRNPLSEDIAAKII